MGIEPHTDKSEFRNLLNVTGASIWLKDKESGDIICRQAAGIHVEKVRGYHLKQKTGISGWVSASGQSVIVSDTREDSRYDSGVEQKMEIEFRSILSVPLFARPDSVALRLFHYSTCQPNTAQGLH